MRPILAALVLAGAMALAGCAGAPQAEPPREAATPEQASTPEVATETPAATTETAGSTTDSTTADSIAPAATTVTVPPASPTPSASAPTMPPVVVADLDCAETTTAETPFDGGAGVPGPKWRIPDSWLKGLDNTDRVEPQGDDVLVVNRDGRTIAAVRLVETGEDTWWIDAFAACADAGIELDWPPPPVPAEVPDIAELACDGEEVDVVTPFVRPQADGVHVRIVNTSQAEILYSFGATGGGGGNGAGPGTTEQVWTFGPGRVTFTCYDPTSDVDPSEVPHRAHVTIVDPEGLFVPVALTACLDGITFASAPSYPPDVKGFRGTPVEVARKLLARNGITPDDVVERAGYPDEVNVRVRAQRNGRTVLVLEVFPAATGGWLVNALEGCKAFFGSEQG